MCNLRTCLFFKNLGEKSAHPYNCLDYYDERTLLKYICPFGSMDIRLFQTVVYQKYGQYSQPLKFILARKSNVLNYANSRDTSKRFFTLLTQKSC